MNGDAAIGRAGASFAALCLALTICGCYAASSSPDGSLEEARQLCANRQWREAMVPIKTRLLQSPDDPEAHYLLGECYARGIRDYCTLAEGELLLTLSLLEETGNSAPAPTEAPDAFKAAVYEELVRVELRRAYQCALVAAPVRWIEELFDSAREYTRLGLAAAPEAEKLHQMDDWLKKAAAPPKRHGKAPSTAPPLFFSISSLHQLVFE